MKKLIILLLLLSNWLFLYSWVNAQTIRIVSRDEIAKQNTDLTRADVFNFFAWYFDDKIPESYKYINLNFTGLDKDSKVYSSLQKLVYLNLLENKRWNIEINKYFNKYLFFKYAEKIFSQKFLWNFNISKIKKQNTTYGDILLLKSLINANNYKINFLNNQNKKIEEKKQIFLNVYKTLQTSFYNKDKLDKIKMFNEATQWLVKWAWDKFTVYFPPVENKWFEQSLKWEYEWIWAYVDMEQAWVFKVISPISWSPAEKAWLRWWDIILKVNWKEIKPENSLSEIISWIKWKAWTKVILTVKRWTNIFDITVIRWKITIKDIDYKILNSRTFYIKLRIFWPTIAKDFREALLKLKTYRNVDKVVVDLRNNPGWYLGQVTDILSYFVKAWDPVAVVKYPNNIKKIYSSKGYNLVDFSKYKIVILQNSWSASASEIMIWWIKDYYPKTQLIGTKTYWKGSVQTIKEYVDGSSLKYTIAKWFTWKSETWIDWIWIQPTIEMKADYKRWEIDEALQRAIRLK